MQNKDLLKKLAKFAYITSIIGMCTVGICPSFGAIAIAVPITLKKKKAPMDDEIKKMNKKSLILGTISLVLFVVDVIVLSVLNSKFGWF